MIKMCQEVCSIFDLNSLTSQKSIPKRNAAAAAGAGGNRPPVGGVENGAFNFEGPEVSPERLHADLEAQHRYRQEASPIAPRRDEDPFSTGGQAPEPPDPRIRNSLQMINEPANRATYLELQGEPLHQVELYNSLHTLKFIFSKKTIKFLYHF